jgi:nitrile hydratase
VFHAAWEGRVLAMRRVLGATGKINPNGFRPAIESIPPAEYLSNSYYQNWFAALVSQLIESRVVTPEEIATGKPAAGPVQPATTLKPEEAAALPFRTPTPALETERLHRFQVGQRVRARIINPAGHTRLPRYVRGKIGVIEQERGIQALADTDVYGRGANSQRVYSVRFAARELWGEQASSRDAVYIDLWDDYLDAA